MNEEKDACAGTSRRQFLVTAGAAIMASYLPLDSTLAQTVAKYRRMNLSDPKSKGVLESYKKAVTAMLKLPPTDPRNWYRNAFTHTLDCPHGNWWFPPWHRGYLGWFEQTCRQLSGDSGFALPYWDWTAEPRIPASFFDGVLDPSDPAYIVSLTVFQDQFAKPMSDFWNSLSQDQLKELKLRGYNSIDDVWNDVKNNPMFFPPSQARTLTQSNPNFDEKTQKAVSIGTIKDALAPADYLNFGSDKAKFHSQTVGFDILEGQPHNNVHNNVGGFMGDFLSPVDPIFFMHHSNIDRLWDVWTRKQQGLGLPTLPTGVDLVAWKKEPFLFYIDADGKPVQKNTAGDYATIGDFNYDYQPGSGEPVISISVKPSEFSNKLFGAKVSSNILTVQRSTQAVVEVPEALRDAVMAPTGPRLFARITIQPPTDTRGVQFHVVLNPSEGAQNVTLENPSYAGTFEFFGRHQHEGRVDSPVSFVVGLTEAVKKLRGINILKANEPLNVHVVPGRKGVILAPLEVALSSISVGAF
jgi:hypothetical protein